MAASRSAATDSKANSAIIIGQAWQAAIACHRSGRLQEAEDLYAAILQSDATNAGAHHNLGVIQVDAKKFEPALTHLLTAIELQPAEPQYWLSYLAALTTAKRWDDASAALKWAKEHGLQGGEVDRLAATIGKRA